MITVWKVVRHWFDNPAYSFLFLVYVLECVFSLSRLKIPVLNIESVGILISTSLDLLASLIRIRIFVDLFTSRITTPYLSPFLQG